MRQNTPQLDATTLNLDLLLDGGFQLSILIRGIPVAATLVLMLRFLSWFSNCCPDVAIIFLRLKVFPYWLNSVVAIPVLIFPEGQIIVFMFQYFNWRCSLCPDLCNDVLIPDPGIITLILQLLSWCWCQCPYAPCWSWHQCPHPDPGPAFDVVLMFSFLILASLSGSSNWFPDAAAYVVLTWSSNCCPDAAAVVLMFQCCPDVMLKLLSWCSPLISPRETTASHSHLLTPCL